MIGTTIGSYKILELIGKGGMAAVYRAYQTNIDRDVAIKVLTRLSYSEAVRRFKREARLIARLEHAHILPIYDFDDTHVPPYIVMRYLQGGTLRDIMSKSLIPLPEVAYIFQQIGSALTYAHEHGVVHRDIKPSNIMVDSEGSIFVTDFGIARLTSMDSTDIELTKTGEVFGTPEYMSPEQVKGDKELDHRTDIYALGIMLFEMLTGQLPFTASTVVMVFIQHLQEPPPRPSEINQSLPPSLDDIISKALAKDPDERFSSVSEFVEAFMSALGVQSASVPVKLRLAVAETMRTVHTTGIEQVPVDVALDGIADDQLPELMLTLRDILQQLETSVVLSPQDLKTIMTYDVVNMEAYFLRCVAEWSQERYQLDSRFVKLAMLIDKGEYEQQRWVESDTVIKYDNLGDLLKYTDYPAFVILGSPGSGKSTLLRWYQLDQSVASVRDNTENITFLIQLSRYRPDSPSPRTWLNAHWTRLYPNLPILDTLLDKGHVVLLLDALNEMYYTTSTEYHQMVARWRDFTQELVEQGNRVVFSCRSLDYSASLSSNDLRIPQIQLQPLNDHQVKEFLHNYLPDNADAIWNKLHKSPQLDLFRTPFFLKLFLDQIAIVSTVPESLSELFTGFIRQALKREIMNANPLFSHDELLTERDHMRLSQDKWASPFDLPERGLLIQSLTKLAFAMQKDMVAHGLQVRIDYDAACDLIDNAHAEDIIKAGIALNLLDEDVSREEILFFHQLLQEFFAARHFVKNPNVEYARVEWEIGRVEPSLEQVIANLDASDPLPAFDQTGWEETIVLATEMMDTPEDFISNLIDANLPLAARCATATGVSVSEQLKDTIRERLIERTHNSKADLRSRINAGLALGLIGDPRFEHREGTDSEYLLPVLVKIEDGDYLIGDDTSEFEREKPRHLVNLESFEIAKFPVTNAEYAYFVSSGAYEDSRWWDTEEAKLWRIGSLRMDKLKAKLRAFREEIMQYALSHVKETLHLYDFGADDVVKIRTLDDKGFEDWLKLQFAESEQFTEPNYWFDDAYNNPNQPVVGVSWYEARAYCKWLSAQTNQTFALPTELQWEAAAAGRKARRYAFGDDLEGLLCNTSETHIRRTSPIDIFPGGETPEGLVDMSGNIYEWTTSILRDYPYIEDDRRKDINLTEVYRILRGGSWFYLSNLARVSFRGISLPIDRRSNAGFRLVRLSKEFIN